MPGVPAAWAGAGDLLAGTEAALGSRAPQNTDLLDAAARTGLGWQPGTDLMIRHDVGRHAEGLPCPSC
jgi:hypothetical protein